MIATQLAPPKPRHYAHSLCRYWTEPESTHLIRFNPEDVAGPLWRCPLVDLLCRMQEGGQLSKRQVADLLGDALGMVAKGGG